MCCPSPVLRACIAVCHGRLPRFLPQVLALQAQVAEASRGGDTLQGDMQDSTAVHNLQVSPATHPCGSPNTPTNCQLASHPVLCEMLAFRWWRAEV